MLKSRWFHFPYIGAGPMLAAAVLVAGILSVVWPHLHGIETYPDPVASGISWTGYYKAKDIRMVELAVVLFTGLTITITLLARRIASAQPDLDLTGPVDELLLISLIPAAWRFGVALCIPTEHLPPFRFLAAFPIMAVFALVGIARYRTTIRREQITVIGSGIMVAGLLSLFAGLSFPTAITRLFAKAVFAHATDPQLEKIANGCMAGAVGLTVLVIVIQWIISSTPDIFESRVLRTLTWVQLPLPLLFFYLIPPLLIDEQHRIRTVYPTVLVVTLSVGCVIAWVFMWRRFWSAAKDLSAEFPVSRAIAPAAVAAIVLFVFAGSVGFPIAYRDYFHWGEQALPWQQWWYFGKRPYIDFVPIHGLMLLARGFFNQVFFDGTMGSFGATDNLLMGLSAISLALAGCMLLTPLGALVLLTGALGYYDRMYFLAPALFVVASPSLLRKPAKLLSIWIIICLLMVAYNPAIGPAFVIGTIPLALWLVYRLCFENRIGLGIITLVVVAVAFVGWKIVPARLTGIEFTHFILENAWTNEVAHGIPWEAGFNLRSPLYGVGSTQFQFEVGRCGWAVVALLSVAFFWQEFRRPVGTRRTTLLVLAGCAPLIMFLTVPWILVRMDSGFGRSGSLARFAIYTVLPALVILFSSREKLIRSLLISVFVIGYFYPYNPAPTDLDSLTHQAVIARRIPSGCIISDGREMGLPLVGQVLQPTPNFLPAIVRMKKDLAEFLKPGETYADLTNQQALYYYLNLPCPVRYQPFVAANSRLAGGEVQQLREHPVPVILIGPAGWLDDVRMSLRTYELYREFALKYRPVQRDEYLFLVDRNRLPNPETPDSIYELDLLDTVFATPNLLRLPVSWGQSFSAMKDRFDHVADMDVTRINFSRDIKLGPSGRIKPTGKTPYWEYSLPPGVKDGAAADFMRISFAEDVKDPQATKLALRVDPIADPVSAETAISCRWITGEGKYSKPVLFKARPGDLLIPLGSYPHWLLDKSPMTFRLDLQNPDTVNWLKISRIEFLRLKPL